MGRQAFAELRIKQPVCLFFGQGTLGRLFSGKSDLTERIGLFRQVHTEQLTGTIVHRTHITEIKIGGLRFVGMLRLEPGHEAGNPALVDILQQQRLRHGKIIRLQFIHGAAIVRSCTEITVALFLLDQFYKSFQQY